MILFYIFWTQINPNLQMGNQTWLGYIFFLVKNIVIDNDLPHSIFKVKSAYFKGTCKALLKKTCE